MSRGSEPEHEASILRQELDATRRELEVLRAQWAATDMVRGLSSRLPVDAYRRLPRPLVRGLSGGLRQLRARTGAQPFPHRSLDRPVRRTGAILGGDAPPHVYLPYARVLDGEVEPLVAPAAGATVARMRIAIVVPPFDFGSGGHSVVFHLGRELEALGHHVSYWQDDPFGERSGMGQAALREAIDASFGAVGGEVHATFERWSGADVVVATGWQTAYTAMTLPGCAARAYLVNDHEPEFYATSLESFYAERTYSFGLAPIVGGGGWLAQQLRERYGSEAVATYDYPVAAAFRARDLPRRDDTIVVYGRTTTPRRAVGLALMALEELTARRPGLRVVLFGDKAGPGTPFPYEHLGPIDAEELSWVYSEATVGLAFSLTHASLVPNDMMACGLPVVALEGYGTGVEHAGSDLLELAPPSPSAIAAAVERLLDDRALRERRAAAGAAHVLARSWTTAGRRVEAGLRQALVTQAGELVPGGDR
ncbi:MAG: glycosyltransferase family 4 protein [Patulibacter minatonensis]